MVRTISALLLLLLSAAVISAVSATDIATASDPSGHTSMNAVAMHVNFIKDVVHPARSNEDARRRAQGQESLETMCKEMGGSMIDQATCEICPRNASAGCCIIDLDTFDFKCDVCERINGRAECAQVTCGLTQGAGYGCNGCGDYSTGKACFDFECSGKEGIPCVCNSITWDGSDCGSCSIDSSGNPVFDCRGVGGPRSSAPQNSGIAALIVISGFALLANLM